MLWLCCGFDNSAFRYGALAYVSDSEGYDGVYPAEEVKLHVLLRLLDAKYVSGDIIPCHDWHTYEIRNGYCCLIFQDSSCGFVSSGSHTVREKTF